MIPKIFSILFLSCLLHLYATFPSWAVESETKSEQSAFTLEVTDNLINLKSDQASFKEILKDLEKKTGIKVKIFDGVKDKKVSLNITSLPIFAIHTLLEKMDLENFAVAYDAELYSDVIYVLSEGQDINEVIKGKAVIRPARFADGKNVKRIKGHEIETITTGKNKIPIRYVKDEVILKFHLGVTEKEIEEVFKKHNLVLIADKSLSKIGYVKARIPDGRDVVEVIKKIRKDYKVKVPEPNYIAGILTVNDPLYESQWYVPDTNFDKAWGELKNKSGVKVAVIDSGVNGEHPDLQGKIIDGYDFFNNDADAMDDHGHGTFVSGIIAATSNKIGIKGLYDYAKILPIKVIDATGIGTYEDAAKGLIYAADNGAKVINLSIGGYGFSFMLQDAVDYALEKGCIVVAAGGNDGIEQPIYPAAYPDVIGVSALGYNGQIWTDSNSGRHIDVSVPGVSILSTGLDDDYVYSSGTSASASMVSALAGLLTSERPDLSSSFVERLIMQSAKDLGDKGRDKVYGSGEIDAIAALEQEVEPFHDIAVRSVYIEPMFFEKNKLSFIVAEIENRGTAKSENFDIEVYQIIGDEKKEINRQEGIEIISKVKVVFPSRLTQTENKIIKILIITKSIKEDFNKENNEKTKVLEYTELDANLFVLHKVNPGVHQWIAGEAFRVWPNDTNHEMYTYIGSPTYEKTYNDFDGIARDTTNNYSDNITTDSKHIIYGAQAEDYDGSGYDNPFGETRPYFRHFWNRGNEATWNDGYLGYDSAVNRAYKYWTGGYGYDGSYDSDWGNGGIQGRGVKYLYANNQKPQAYEYLGHIVHLLGDMSVPAHVLGDGHPPWNDDNFEEYMRMYDWSVANDFVYKRYGSQSVTGTVLDYSGGQGLYNIFYHMAEEADNFESDGSDGGSDDDPSHYNALGDVSWDECSVHQAALQPYVIKQVAALYKWFWNETANDRDDDGDGFTENQNDCNDNNSSIHPNATETCNGIDDNCANGIDENLTRPTTCGVGDCTGNTGTETCTSGNWGNDTCDPYAGSSSESCDNRDNDCDGSTDESLNRPTTCGVGACTGNTGTETCSAGSWGSDTCNPLAGATPEVCGNGIDENCDGQTCSVNCTDNDSDGYGVGPDCLGPDCDDTNANIHPGADDSNCDGVDDDCDLTPDDAYVISTTNCGIGVCQSTGLLECISGNATNSCNPGTPTENPEVTCNDGLDNDCDGPIDLQDRDCMSTDAWLDPDTHQVLKNNNFDLNVIVDSGTQLLGTYQFDITFNQSMINVDTTQGTNGVDAGADGFITAVNPDNTNGTLSVNGFDITGTGPGNMLDVLTIHFSALGNLGITEIDLTVSTLTDETGQVIGTPAGLGAVVAIMDFLIGDVNGDGNVNIVDALFVARFAVGLSVNPFNSNAADVDCDGNSNIVDALYIARHAAGLTVSNWCKNMIVASGAGRYERPRINNNGEIVWTQQSGGYQVWSNLRGQISSGGLDRDPDINDNGEIIWRFGDGGQGPDGIMSNIRGLIYDDQGGLRAPYYDTHRINNNGEIVWSRGSDGYVEEIYSNIRGQLTSSTGYTNHRQLAINDNGEVVSVFYDATPSPCLYYIYSTDRGFIANDCGYRYKGKPAINNQGEIVWHQSNPSNTFNEIWSSSRGLITSDGERPSINNYGEIVWQQWDGNDNEIFSNIRGQITNNNVNDSMPYINDIGVITWLENNGSIMATLP